MHPFRIVRVLGVDVVGDASLVALGVLLSWVIYLDLTLPESTASATEALVAAASGGVLFLGTVLAHEIGHAAVAQRRGIVVKKIRLMIFGGAAELEESDMTPQTELAVAIVGPITSALLGGMLLLLSLAFSASSAAGGTLRFVGSANLVLAVFNLMPGLPLDGGRVLRSILWRRTGNRDRATRIALQVGRMLGVAIIGTGGFLVMRTGTPLGIWVILVGWFLMRMAAASTRSHRLEAATRGRSVGQLMRPITEAVQGSMSVADAIDMYQMGPRLRTLVVSVDDRIVGILGQLEVDRIDAMARGVTTVASAMTRIGPADVVDVNTALIEALQREAGAARHIVATSEGRVVGLIGHAEIAELLEFKESSD
jgi:Zn-dependent protease